MVIIDSKCNPFFDCSIFNFQPSHEHKPMSRHKVRFGGVLIDI